MPGGVLSADLRGSKRHRDHADGSNADPYHLEVTWIEGPRNAAWEELWRRILADVLGARSQPEDSGATTGLAASSDRAPP